MLFQMLNVLDNRGVCSKCEKKLHDVQSYADHQGRSY